MPEKSETSDLTVAITGPTGTFGLALVPLLQDDDRIARVVGVARRPFDPSERGWSKMDYRRGDVRDPATLQAAFDGADVVVHLAFLILSGSKETTRSINVEGTLNTFRAAASAGVSRFVYASSIAAYGFHRDNPTPIKENWPTRPSDRFFYAQEKAELEHLLQEEAARHPEMDLYLLRPPIVLGPDAVGAKVQLPAALGLLGRGVLAGIRRLGSVPAVVPDMRLQLIHQDDVAEALRLCIVGAGPPGAYNIAADDVLDAADVARELGLLPLRVPGRPTAAVARLVSRLPLPSGAQWIETLSHPAIMDTTKAKTELGWQPRHSAIDSLRATMP